MIAVWTISNVLSGSPHVALCMDLLSFERTFFSAKNEATAGHKWSAVASFLAYTSSIKDVRYDFMSLASSSYCGFLIP